MEVSEKVIGLPVPLEQLPLSGELNGRWGRNRSNGISQISAETDLEAIQTWLAEFESSPHTWRNYRKEVERLLLWSLLERGKPFSSLTREDLAAFEVFLTNPSPRERWCGSRAPRGCAQWRPFRGPLGARSCHPAVIVINSLFTYLVAAGYLAGNPLALRRRRSVSTIKPETVERFLDSTLWQHVLSFVEALPVETSRQQAAYERVRYLFILLYLLGPRVSEVASHTMGSFVEVRGKWWWRVTGKGGKTTRIPANQEMLAALVRYRTFYGLPSLPLPQEKTPLVLNLRGSRGISANMIYRIVKAVMQKAARELKITQPHQASKLYRASTHWLRHTAITHQADAGIELRYLNKSARHTKLETTAIYLHADEESWHEAMEKHKIQR